MTQISAGFHTRLVIAPLTNRFSAYVLDSIIMSSVGWVFIGAEMIIPAVVAGVLLVLTYLLWPVFWLRHMSAPPGKLVGKLLVQPVPGPGRLSWSMVLRREAVQWLPGLAICLSLTLIYPKLGSIRALDWMTVGLCLSWFLLDTLWAFTNQQRQTLHDRAAGTVVVQKVRMWGPAQPPVPVPGGAPTSTAPPAPPAAGR